MPRPKINKGPVGRPLKPINWDYVDLMLQAGCPGTEIALRFELHPVSFYERCQREKGVNFTEYSSWRLNLGKSNIKVKQYTKACKGDNTMLLHCGKHLCGQRDTTEIAVNDETAKTFASIMNQISQLQEQRNGIPNSDSPGKEE